MIKFSKNDKRSLSFRGKPKTYGENCKFKDVDFSGTVYIGDFVSIWGPNIKISGRINPIEIGSFCSIALNTVILSYNHKINRASTYPILRNIFDEKITADIESSGPIRIEEDVWIGANSVVLGNVTIGRGAIVSAGSVVTKDISPYTIVGGIPAKPIKKRFSEESIKLIEDSKWWEWDIQKINDNRDFFEKEFK